MKEPQRLLRGQGPAQELMTRGSVLRVPSGARQRALQFTGVAVGVSATGTAAAASATSLAKSVVLWVSLGAVGGGVASLTVSEVVSRLDAPHAQTQQAAPAAANPAVRAPATPVPAEAPAVEAPAVEAPAAAEVPVAASPVAAAPELRTAPSSKSKPEAAPATPPTASVGAFGETPVRTSLVEEQRMIETARAAVARGDSASALATLDAYDRGYARKQFGPEALALRVQALAAAGQIGLARSLARDFEQRYPHHPLLARVQSVVAR